MSVRLISCGLLAVLAGACMAKGGGGGSGGGNAFAGATAAPVAGFQGGAAASASPVGGAGAFAPAGGAGPLPQAGVSGGVPAGGAAGAPIGGMAGVPMGGSAGVPVGGSAGVPAGGVGGAPMGGSAGLPMAGSAGMPATGGSGGGADPTCVSAATAVQGVTEQCAQCVCAQGGTCVTDIPMCDMMCWSLLNCIGTNGCAGDDLACILGACPNDLGGATGAMLVGTPCVQPCQAACGG